MELLDIYESISEEMDTNTSAVSVWMDLRTCTHFVLYVEELTGSHATHILTLEISPDKVLEGNYAIDHDGETISLTGTGYVENHDIAHIAYGRVKVTTPEGSASTVRVYVQSFRGGS